MKKKKVYIITPSLYSLEKRNETHRREEIMLEIMLIS